MKKTIAFLSYAIWMAGSIAANGVTTGAGVEAASGVLFSPHAANKNTNIVIKNTNL